MLKLIFVSKKLCCFAYHILCYYLIKDQSKNVTTSSMYYE